MASKLIIDYYFNQNIDTSPDAKHFPMSALCEEVIAVWESIPRQKCKASTQTEQTARSIKQIEKYRELITRRVIRGTITRMRNFNMTDKVKPKRLWTKGLKVLTPIKTFSPKSPRFVVVDDGRLFRMGGYSDSE